MRGEWIRHLELPRNSLLVRIYEITIVLFPLRFQYSGIRFTELSCLKHAFLFLGVSINLINRFSSGFDRFFFLPFIVRLYAGAITIGVGHYRHRDRVEWDTASHAGHLCIRLIWYPIYLFPWISVCGHVSPWTDNGNDCTVHCNLSRTDLLGVCVCVCLSGSSPAYFNLFEFSSS